MSLMNWMRQEGKRRMKNIGILGSEELGEWGCPLSEMERIAWQEWTDVEIKSSVWIC